MKSMKNDIIKLMGDTATSLVSYSAKFVDDAYRGCTQWPLVDSEGHEIVDKPTGDKYSEAESPVALAQLIKTDVVKVDELHTNATASVETKGYPNSDKLERSGRVIETFGCAPWTKLNSHIRTDIVNVVKSK